MKKLIENLMVPQIWEFRLIKVKPYIPLSLIFLSGCGFTFQSLIVKLLDQNGFINSSFYCVFSRGIMQTLICSIVVYFDKERNYGFSLRIFGDTLKIRFFIFLRTLSGFFAVAFSLLSVEKMPIGDSNVLIMLSPIFTAFSAYMILGEPWKVPEFLAALISLIGAACVVHPSFIFGGRSLSIIGSIFALASAISKSVSFILIRILGTTSKMPWANIGLAQGSAYIILSVMTMLTFGYKFDKNVSTYNILLLCSGGFVGACSQIAQTYGMQREKSATASAMRMSDVLFGFMWQLALTNDKMSYTSIIGAFLILISVLIIIVFKTITTKGEDNTTNSDVKYENLSTVEVSTHNPIVNNEFDDENGIELSAVNRTSKSFIQKWKQSLKNHFNTNQSYVIVPTINISNFVLAENNRSINKDEEKSDESLL